MVSIEGIDADVGIRGLVKESRVFEESILGETFFHASICTMSSVSDATRR